MKAKIDVRSASKTYPVVVGESLLFKTLSSLLKSQEADQVFIIIDENADRYHRERILAVLSENKVDYKIRVIPQGETSKSAKEWIACLDFLLDNDVRRNTPLLAVGGGVTGDLAGFAASTALRGIPLIHIPTTLLAMVDSSIGGKTGINHTKGKNLIGTFYQPEAVIADIDFLKTLPRHEWINGLSEILKYGAIEDTDILEKAEIFFEENPGKISPGELISLISRCVKIKADIVENDEFEGDIRAYLNFGHTYAHALEKACGFNKMNHGEAVYLGMLAATELSNLTGSTINPAPLKKYRPLYNFRVTKDDLSVSNLMEYMKSDKKRLNENLRFILLNQWQHPVIKTVNNKELIEHSWMAAINELNPIQ